MAFLERQVISQCGKAVHGWRMIKDGDRVAVGLSGGKDSLSLVWLLNQRRQRVPIDYKIIAMHIDMGFGTINQDELREFCAGIGVELQMRHTDYGPRAHSPENRKNSPCFFCAMHRRRELFEMCGEFGCNKLALAHHQDDIFETFLMNSLYSGSLATMLPVQPFFHGEITMIRPLALCSAKQTAAFARRMEFPVQPPCCPSAAEGNRGRMRQLLDSLMRENKKVRQNLWHALSNAGLATMPTPPMLDKSPRKKK